MSKILESLGYKDGSHLPAPGKPHRARASLGQKPPDMEPGYSPFGPATVVANWAIDWGTLAPSLFGVPQPSTHAIPTQGTQNQLSRLDHDHGLVKGPPLEGLVITYSGPGVPTGVTRTDTPGGVVAATVISYAGPLVSSVVTTRTGYTITTVPAYTGTDITSVARTVA